MTVFKIDIVSDTVCPWCYIGSKKLESAIAKYQQLHPDSSDTFEINWLPFYLNPDSPKIGIDKTGFYQSKFGVERTRTIFERLAAIGAQEGINFKFGGKTGNTRDSHRLIHMAGTQSRDLQSRVVKALFASYFEHEGDITDRETLIQAAATAGIDPSQARQWLESGAGGPEVDAQVEMARRQQITGVPNFVIQNRFELGGAQDAEVFLKLFEKIKASEGA